MKHQEAAAPEEPDAAEKGAAETDTAEKPDAAGGTEDVRASLGRRRRILIWVVAGAVALTGAGVVLAGAIRSPPRSRPMPRRRPRPSSPTGSNGGCSPPPWSYGARSPPSSR